MKNSGYGRELSRLGIGEFVNEADPCCGEDRRPIANMELDAPCPLSHSMGRVPRSPGRVHAVAPGRVSARRACSRGRGGARRRESAWWRNSSASLGRARASGGARIEFARADDSFRAALINAEVALEPHQFGDRVGILRVLREWAHRAPKSSATVDARSGLPGRPRAGARARGESRRRAIGSKFDPARAPCYADLERFAEADAIYRQAFYSYEGASPFSAGVGLLPARHVVGELVPVPDTTFAALVTGARLPTCPAT